MPVCCLKRVFADSIGLGELHIDRLRHMKVFLLSTRFCSRNYFVFPSLTQKAKLCVDQLKNSEILFGVIRCSLTVGHIVLSIFFCHPTVT